MCEGDIIYTSITNAYANGKFIDHLREYLFIISTVFRDGNFFLKKCYILQIWHDNDMIVSNPWTMKIGSCIWWSEIFWIKHNCIAVSNQKFRIRNNERTIRLRGVEKEAYKT